MKIEYELPQKPTARRTLLKQPLLKTPVGSSSVKEQELETMAGCSSSIFHQHVHGFAIEEHDSACQSCKDKAATITMLSKEVDTPRKENEGLHRKILSKKNKIATFFHYRIKTDEKMNLYTGIFSIPLFNVIFSLLSLYLPKLKYLRGRSTNSIIKQSSDLSSQNPFPTRTSFSWF